MDSDAQQDGDGRVVATRRLDHDFSVVLAKTINAVQQDPAQFRNIIYEMARVQLQREAWRQDPPMNILELRRMMLALETAIERVETQAAQGDGLMTFTAGGLLEAATQNASAQGEVVLIHPPSTIFSPLPNAIAHAIKTVNSSGPLRAIVRLGLLAVLAATVVIVADRAFNLLGRPVPAVIAPAETSPTAPAVAAPVQPVAPSPVPSGPLPSVYGVYAVVGGQLYELEALVGRAPDIRVFMSAVIKTPSQTLLPNGDISFIVYRRDIVSSAPDRVTVRVIAKVARALKFTKAGQSITANVDGEWAIRNVSFDYRVAPSTDSPEMIVIKSETGAPALAPGRYALVVKGQMFDFTVEGPITQTTQCLERTEAMNGSFYSECREAR
jgi:hypothetical protein